MSRAIETLQRRIRHLEAVVSVQRLSIEKAKASADYARTILEEGAEGDPNGYRLEGQLDAVSEWLNFAERTGAVEEYENRMRRAAEVLGEVLKAGEYLPREGFPKVYLLKGATYEAAREALEELPPVYRQPAPPAEDSDRVRALCAALEPFAKLARVADPRLRPDHSVYGLSRPGAREPLTVVTLGDFRNALEALEAYPAPPPPPDARAEAMADVLRRLLNSATWANAPEVPPRIEVAREIVQAARDALGTHPSERLPAPPPCKLAALPKGCPDAADCEAQLEGFTRNYLGKFLTPDALKDAAGSLIKGIEDALGKGFNDEDATRNKARATAGDEAGSAAGMREEAPSGAEEDSEAEGVM